MKVKIYGTDNTVELRLMSNRGVNWADDFIDAWNGLGDEPHQIQYDPDDDIYYATQDVVEWWVEAIKAQQKLDDRLDALSEEYGWSAISRVIYQVVSTDLLDSIGQMHKALDDAFGEGKGME